MTQHNFPSPTDIHIGKQLRGLRKERYMSWKELENAINHPLITAQNLHDCETGTMQISATFLWEISQALDVPPLYFFEGLPGSSAQEEMSRTEALHLALLHSLPVKVRADMLCILAALVHKYQKPSE